MRIYKRMIRPMIVPPALHGMCCKASPLFSDDYWVDDDGEEVYRKTWEKFIKDKDYMSSLEIQERYVEIEPPVVEIENFKPGDTIIITIDPNIIDVDTVQRWVDSYTVAYPQCDVWVKFKGIDIAKK